MSRMDMGFYEADSCCSPYPGSMSLVFARNGGSNSHKRKAHKRARRRCAATAFLMILRRQAGEVLSINGRVFHNVSHRSTQQMSGNDGTPTGYSHLFVLVQIAGVTSAEVEHAGSSIHKRFHKFGTTVTKRGLHLYASNKDFNTRLL